MATPLRIFESCLDSNPESCLSKQARYQLSHPSSHASQSVSRLTLFSILTSITPSCIVLLTITLLLVSFHILLPSYSYVVLYSENIE